MGKVKSMMMDVEDFVYDFYDSYGNLTETPKFIVDKAIDKFGWSFGSYASEVLQNASEEMGGQWDIGYWIFEWMQCNRNFHSNLSDV
jgi:TPR repeat protein